MPLSGTYWICNLVGVTFRVSDFLICKMGADVPDEVVGGCSEEDERVHRCTGQPCSPHIAGTF